MTNSNILDAEMMWKHIYVQKHRHEQKKLKKELKYRYKSITQILNGKMQNNIVF